MTLIKTYLLTLCAVLSLSVANGQTIKATKLILTNFPFIQGTKDTTLATVTDDMIPAAKAVKIYANRHLGGRSMSTAAPADNNTIRWNGTQWVPSARNLYDIVSANYTVSSTLNEVFVEGQTAGITLNLPPCNTANNGAKFIITKSGSDTFSISIDPSGSETFQDGAAVKRLYSQGTSVSCTCTFVSGTGEWHFSNM